MTFPFISFTLVCDLEGPAVAQKDWLRLPCLLCIKPDLPRGRFDWLKHGIMTSMAIFHAEEWEPTAMHQQHWFIIHIYTCSLWNIYTFTLFVYVSLLIFSPLAVFLIYVGIFACCVFLLLWYSFFSYSPCGGTLQGIDDRSWWQRKIKGRQQTFQRHTLVLLYLFLCLSRQTSVYMLDMDYHFLMIIFHSIFSQSLIIFYIIVKYCTCPLWHANLLLETL